MVANLNSNSVALAGEFAVLSQLALRGYDANLTLGHTKNVDILVSHPMTGKMFKLEVKTNHKNNKSSKSSSKLFGNFVSAWMMNEKHESIKDPNLYYCFVNISALLNKFFKTAHRAIENRKLRFDSMESLECGLISIFDYQKLM